MTFENGNQVNKKLTTHELKIEAYRQYCAHIASGEPKNAWCFEHPFLTLTSETMEKYIKEEPSVFDTIHKSVAHSKSLKHWFSVLSATARGENQKGNVAAQQIIFRNMFRWDAKDPANDSNENNFLAAQEMVMKQLKEMQDKTSPEVSLGC